MTVRPATVRLPERAPPVFGAMMKLTLPSPAPVNPDATVIHGTLLTAVHAHRLDVITETVRVPPVAEMEKDVGVTLSEQPPVPAPS